MAAIYEVMRGPSEAVRAPATTPEAATIASCLDAYLPIYSFSASRSMEKVRKLKRVDSMPVVPDFFSEPTYNSPLGSQGGNSPPLMYVLPHNSSFNNLPTDIHCQVPEQYRAVDLEEAGSIYDGMSLDDCMSPSEPQMVPSGGSLKGQAAGGRAQPRRHPSDVRLSRSDLSFAGDASDSSGSDDALEVPIRSVLEAALMTLWEDRAERGLFRYDVTQCPTRVVPGWLGFVAQLNEGRATKKRATEITVDRVLQPFDPAKFNFKKAATSEALVAFCPERGDNDRNDGARGRRPRIAAPAVPLAAATSGGSSPNLVIINVSPIDYGHVLLVPRVLDNLQQAVNGDLVLLALQFARELGSPHFRVGYNSLGAYATINHLHFQSYYLAATMPCECAPTVPLPGVLAAPPVPGATTAVAMVLSRKRQYDEMAGGSAVRVSRLRGYPVNAFVVEAGQSCDGGGDGGMEAVAAVVGVAVERLQTANQPFNLLISDAGRRVFIFPQCFAERQAAGTIPEELLDTGVNPAAFEIAGHLLLKRAEDYEGATEELACRLLAQASLPEDRFMAVAEMCFGGDAGAGCN